MQLLGLGAADRPRFETFRCADRRYDWTLDIEETIQEHLADLLDGPGCTLTAIGWGDVDCLAGLIVWGPDDDPEAWFVKLLATARGHRRHHVAERLKREVLRRAAEDGMLAVRSYVDHINEPMLKLNRKLGADIRRRRRMSRTMVCTIDPLAVPPPTF